MQFEAQLQLTPEIVKLGVRKFWFHHYFRKRELFITAIFLCLLVAFGLLKGKDSWLTVLFIGIYVLLFWAARIKVYFTLLREKMKRFSQLPNGIVRLLLTDKTLILTWGQVRTELKWEQLQEAVEYRGLVLLLWGGMDFSIMQLDQISPDVLLLIRTKAMQARTNTG